MTLDGLGGYGGTGAPPSASNVGCEPAEPLRFGGGGYGGTGAPPSASNAFV
ncbi:MAG TPA: hypothetical protein VFI45_03310 [Candidatus Acidoferrum sp.]|nr:hypothetical protein [Candidatus Acidoferrum sp.]